MTSTDGDTIHLFAAGSLKAALSEIAKAYEGQSGHKVAGKYGPSGLLKDEIATGAMLMDYADAGAYAQRMMRDNPRLDPSFAVFLARENGHEIDGRWKLRANPAHMIVNRVAYRLEEVLACWREIAAPVLWVEARDSASRSRMLKEPGYEDRLKCVALLQRALVEDAGHMLHQERPAEVAQLVADFLGPLLAPRGVRPTM